MQQELQVLDKHLRVKRPEFYADLRKPLAEAEIDALELKFNLVLPADLKMLYSWRNGQDAETYDAFINNSMFMPLEEVLETAAELASMIGLDFEIENWWHRNWLPIFHNGGGCYICYDMGGLFTGQPGQLIEYWNEDNDRNVIAPDLASFIAALNQYYASVPAADFDDYFEIGEISGFPLSFIVE